MKSLPWKPIGFLFFVFACFCQFGSTMFWGFCYFSRLAIVFYQASGFTCFEAVGFEHLACEKFEHPPNPLLQRTRKQNLNT